MVTLADLPTDAAVSRHAAGRFAPADRVRRGPIVLATDGTSRSGAVIVAAQLIADRLDVPLEVVVVLEPTPAYTTISEFVVPSDPNIDEARRDACEIAVTDYVSRYAGGAAPPRVQVRFGGIAAEISRFAREVSATMIVMGSAPHRVFRHTVSGDRAAQVLHSTQCPVLSVPPTFTMLPKTVCVAVDFSPASVAAAQAALLVVRDGGVVVLTHVLPPRMLPPALSVEDVDKPAADVRDLFDRLREELRPSTPSSVKIETRLVIDDPINGILGSVDHLEADLVAVGTHGRNALARILMGSVAESVLHRTDRTVLASPPPPPAEAHHLTRSIDHPDAVTMTASPKEGNEILDIRHGRGHTIAMVASDRPAAAD